MTAAARIAVGLDIGGTAVKLGAVDEEGRLLARGLVPVHRDISFEDFLARVVPAIEGLISRFPVAALGIGVPGVPDPATGMPRGRCPALPALLEGSLPAILGGRFAIPASFGNDAVAAAHGEMRHGAGRSFRRFAVITLGTGIGGAVVIDGKVIDGPDGVSPQFGCISLDPARSDIARPVPGMVENLASATALVKRYRELRPDAEARDARAVFDRARSGEAEALQAVEEVVRWLAQAIGIMSNMLNIEAAIIGGGMSLAGSFLTERIARNVGDFVLPMPGRPPAILPAALGNDAGLIGAALLALDPLSTPPSPPEGGEGRGEGNCYQRGTCFAYKVINRSSRKIANASHAARAEGALACLRPGTMSARATFTGMHTARMARMARAATKGPDDPAYWLAKADEARAIAETMEYPESRSSMLWIARAYTIFADWTKQQRNRNYPRR